MPHNLWRGGFAAGVCAMLGGCGLLPAPAVPLPPAQVQAFDPAASVVAEHLEMMWRLNRAAPAEQAELFQSIKIAAETLPNPRNRLRYALALATLGHGATDADAARQKLTEILSGPPPQTLLPAEQALASICLRGVENRLVLQTEIDRLQAELARRNRERNTTSAASGKRLQAELDENERLRNELAAAQAKLDEISRIERSIIERTPSKPNR